MKKSFATAFLLVALFVFAQTLLTYGQDPEKYDHNSKVAIQKTLLTPDQLKDLKSELPAEFVWKLFRSGQPSAAALLSIITDHDSSEAYIDMAAAEMLRLDDLSDGELAIIFVHTASRRWEMLGLMKMRKTVTALERAFEVATDDDHTNLRSIIVLDDLLNVLLDRQDRVSNSTLINIMKRAHLKEHRTQATEILLGRMATLSNSDSLFYINDVIIFAPEDAERQRAWNILLTAEIDEKLSQMQINAIIDSRQEPFASRARGVKALRANPALLEDLMRK